MKILVLTDYGKREMECDRFEIDAMGNLVVIGDAGSSSAITHAWAVGTWDSVRKMKAEEKPLPPRSSPNEAYPSALSPEIRAQWELHLLKLELDTQNIRQSNLGRRLTKLENISGLI